MYAIVKTGGKQYRVEPGQTLLVERLPQDEGATVTLEPLLVRSDDAVFDAAGLASLEVQATIVGHLRGPKLRVFKFKPKRGYRRRTGHRQELTRIEVTKIGAAATAADSKPAAATTKPAAARETAAAETATATAAPKAAVRKPAAGKTATAAEQTAEAKPAAARAAKAATPDDETAKAKPRASARSKQAAPAEPDAAAVSEEDTDGA